MRVVQIITRSDNIGGAQVHVKDLALGLINRGCNVFVLAGGNGPFMQVLQENNITFYSLKHLTRSINPYHDGYGYWEIFRVLRHLRPDLVAAHTSKAGWLGRLAARSLSIPVVFTAHGWSFIQTAPGIMRRFYLLAEQIAGLISDKIITVSEYDRQFCMRHNIVPSDKISTIYNGIPDVAYTNPEQHRSTPRFVMTARLERPKNHVMLLEALSSLANMQWQLDLVGNGPQRMEIEQCISRLGLEHKIKMLGDRRDVPELLRKAQGFVLISDMEGLPISILEAMRAGLPIIASNVGGVAELVEDGVNGFLIDKGDKLALTNRLAQLFTNMELRGKMGYASRQKFIKQFMLSPMMDKTLEAYNEVIRSRTVKERR